MVGLRRQLQPLGALGSEMGGDADEMIVGCMVIHEARERATPRGHRPRGEFAPRLDLMPADHKRKHGTMGQPSSGELGQRYRGVKPKRLDQCPGTREEFAYNGGLAGLPKAHSDG